ncbi:MAG: LysR family transcriptional regulator [Sutterella sp.]|nr:LysR family transcriptional regulator [Sutterella sp.]
MAKHLNQTSLSSLLMQPRVKAFCVLCETKSFTKAGKILGISQSNISRMISDLEKDLEVTLVEHSLRPIRISHAGQALYQLISQEISTIDNQLMELRANNALLAPLRLGFVESVARTMSFSVVSEIRNSYSRVTVLTGISGYLLRLMDEDQIDVIICPDPFSNRNDLERRFIFREPSIIILPKNSNLPQELTWERLKFCGIPMLKYHTANSGAKLEQNFFNQMGLHFVHRVEVDINALLLDYVAHGLGWALTRPSTLIQHPDLAEKVDVRAMPLPLATRELYAITRKSQHHDLLERVALAAKKCFETECAPKMLEKAPWIAPYLYVSGENASDRMPLYPHLERKNEEVLVY